MAKNATIKPEEQTARSYVDRLILAQLTEMESAQKLGELAERLSSVGVGLATVRSLLASNPDRFAYYERRWIPAGRVEAEGRPLAGCVERALAQFEGPMPANLLIAEVALMQNRTIDEIGPVVERLLASDGRFIRTSNDLIALTSLGFVATDEKFARAIALNGVSADAVDELDAKLAGLDWRASGAVAEAIKRTAPVNLRVLGAVAYRHLNSDDPYAVLLYNAQDFLSAALSVAGYEYGPDGALHPVAETKKWITTAVKLAEKLVPTIELDDAAPIEIKPDELARITAQIAASPATTTAIKLLEENYEVTPGTKTFPDDLANLVTALKGASNVQWVGGDRFRGAGTLPDYIEEVPAPFIYEPSDVLDEEGEPVDVELTDEGLSTSLRKLLAHPLAMDVLDEDITPAARVRPDSVRLVLKSIHRELGTFPLCQMPTGFLDLDPNLQELVVIDADGKELSIWLNNQARLTFGWIDWWLEQPIESGAVFTLTRTNKPNVFEFAWQRDPDPVIHIPSARMEQLRQIGEDSEGRSTLDILFQVFEHWPKGADYLTLLAEVNVVRRATRRLVASLLSSYQCFSQKSGSPVWHFNPKQVELGFDKTKKKFIRK